MLMETARFEFRYLLRNPLMWATAAFTFGLFFLAFSVEGIELGSEGGLLENAAYATVRNYLILSIFSMFVTTAFVANVVIRDDETGFGPIIRSTRITKFQYLVGRFGGAFVVAALCMALMPVAVWLASAMPWTDPAIVGPFRVRDHLFGYFLLALPNMLVTAAVFFALATMTRSMMATYLGVVAFIFGYFSLAKAFAGYRLVALLDPFGARAIEDASRYWTIAERNVTLPDFTGVLLYNRLLCIGAAVGYIALAYVVYRFADRRTVPGRIKEDKPAKPAARAVTGTDSLFWVRTKFEIRQVVTSPAFVILLAWGLFTTFFVLTTQRDPDGRPSYPTTLSMIPEIEESFSMILLVVAIFFAGELVWRERDRRVHEIIDTTPLPNWGYVVPKTIALLLVLIALVLVNVVASISVQLSLGYTDLEIGKYLLWYVLPASFDALLLAALTIFVQSLSPHKIAGWGIMVLFVAWQEFNQFINHDLLNFGAKPEMPLSDINGAASFWKGAWTLRMYWGACAVLLLVVAHLFWRRGVDVRLKPRLVRVPARLRSAAGVVGAAALLVFIATGGYAYYNTNVLNEYRTEADQEADAVDLEKRYWRYYTLPQPTMSNLKLDIALYPEERRAMTRGSAVLQNRTPYAISDVHVRLANPDINFGTTSIAGARLISDDKKHKYRIYRLDAAMQPGEERVLTFETRMWHRGFRSGAQNVRLIENGTFMTTQEIIPAIGMGLAGLIMDPETRRKYGLPEQLVALPRLEDASATSRISNGVSWTQTDITVSTSADQTPIAPGAKISDVTRNGRRTARYVSEAPILMLFSVQSARYAERHRQHAGVDLAVYYHPKHAWNVDQMLDAMAASLDYYRANFGPYQFSHARIVEFPGYAFYAQALPGTIAYSEDLDFISDVRAPETIDFVSFVTAHELAHQYWGHQVRGAETEGALALTETLSQYSALMVAKKLYGEDAIRRGLRFQLDSYLQGRGYTGAAEPPLMRVVGQSWIHSRKGAVVMYLLHKRLGEDAVNRALRSLLAKYRFQGPPYPRSVDLIHALRAEAKTPEDQALITDLFERVTLYDLKVTNPVATQRADGKWDVSVPVEAKKLYVEGSVEKEAPLEDRIEVGLFTAEPGRDAFDSSDVILMERQPIRSGRQVLKFVTTRKPTYAGIDPYNFYIDRNSGDNVEPVGK